MPNIALHFQNYKKLNGKKIKVSIVNNWNMIYCDFIYENCLEIGSATDLKITLSNFTYHYQIWKYHQHLLSYMQVMHEWKMPMCWT